MKRRGRRKCKSEWYNFL